MACTLRLLLTCRRSLTSLGGCQLCACACLPLPASGLQRTHPRPCSARGLGGVRVEPGPSAPWDGREREAFKHGAVAGTVTTLVVVKIVAPYVCRAFARLACRLVGQ